MRKTLIPLLFLAACAGAAPVSPTAARVSDDRVTVWLSDGRTCRAGLAPGQADGALEGCAGYGFAIVVEDPGPVRAAWQGLLRALTLDSVLSPYGTVTITGPDGRAWTFVSPERPD